MLLATALMCMSMNIYHEARSEPLVGQYAVALVTYNRAQKQNANVCKVVTKKGQFSWTNHLVTYRHGQYTIGKTGMPVDKKAWLKAVSIAKVTLMGIASDFTHGATFYHANYVNPNWNRGMKYVGLYGVHHFYKVA